MKAIDTGDSIAAEMAACEWCMFFHHGEQECHRHAPMPLYSLASMLAEEIARAFGREIDAPSNTYWPSVHATDFCGDFSRGAALGSLTIEEQKRLFVRTKSQG